MALTTANSRGSSLAAATPATWTNTANAYDGAYGVVSNTNTVSPLLSAGAAATLIVGGRNFSTLIPQSNAVVNSVTVTVRGLVSNAARWGAPTINAYLGTTPISGSSVTLASAWTTTAASYTASIPGVTIDELLASNFGIGIVFTRTGGSTASVSIDFIDVSVNYSFVTWNGLSLQN